MRYAVEDYRLPSGASALDRGTLSIWKAWIGWIRPALLLALLAVLAHLVMGWLVGLPSPDWSFSPYRYLVRWASHPYPPLISPSYDGQTYGPWVLWAAIAAQLLAVAAGAILGYPLLRRSRRPVAIGALAGLVAAVLHVAFAGLWTRHPLGFIGSMGVPVTLPSSLADAEIRVYVGSTVQNALGVIALWSPVAFGALVGWLARRRRAVT
jgi:hypothetical protein